MRNTELTSKFRISILLIHKKDYPYLIENKRDSHISTVRHLPNKLPSHYLQLLSEHGQDDSNFQ